ncbi:MAG: dTDP-glucose 4,6-dehydratase [Rickettsiales bacterium]
MQKTKNLLVTGGAGFIGSSFVGQQVALGNKVIILDKLTYAGKKENLSWITGDYQLVVADINEQQLVEELLFSHKIDKLIHFAAESHVDNSIANPAAFIETNINGTFSLLAASLKYFKQNANFHFHHISTDEVFGDLPLHDDSKFSELTAYNPSSPYSSSKAASDHLVRSYFRTYNLPITISNCSNNYGERQHEEKLIPTIIRKALEGLEIPIYGNGKNVRDWIHVDDHNRAVDLILNKGKIGETYCIGGNCELDNNEVVNIICEILDEYYPRKDGLSYKKQITYVTDRKGHDLRYAINSTKIERELGFKLEINFRQAILKLIKNILA